MSTKTTQWLVRGGELVAEVDVTLVETDDGWAPHLSLDDAYKLDDVRDALRAGDVKAAARFAARMYRLTPLEGLKMWVIEGRRLRGNKRQCARLHLAEESGTWAVVSLNQGERGRMSWRTGGRSRS